MMTKCRNVEVFGVKHTCTVRQYKRLLQRRGRILACDTREQDSRPGPNIRVLMGLFLMSPFQNIGMTPPIYCTVADIGNTTEWFSGPGTIILKVSKLCINSAYNLLLIRSLTLVSSRPIIKYDTAFYAIKVIVKVKQIMDPFTRIIY